MDYEDLVSVAGDAIRRPTAWVLLAAAMLAIGFYAETKAFRAVVLSRLDSIEDKVEKNTEQIAVLQGLHMGTASKGDG